MIFMVQVFYISSEIKHMKQFLWQTGHCILIYESILTQHFSNVNLQNTIVILVGIIEILILIVYQRFRYIVESYSKIYCGYAQNEHLDTSLKTYYLSI